LERNKIIQKGENLVEFGNILKQTALELLQQ